MGGWVGLGWPGPQKGGGGGAGAASNIPIVMHLILPPSHKSKPSSSTSGTFEWWRPFQARMCLLSAVPVVPALLVLRSWPCTSPAAEAPNFPSKRNWRAGRFEGPLWRLVPVRTSSSGAKCEAVGCRGEGSAHCLCACGRMRRAARLSIRLSVLFSGIAASLVHWSWLFFLRCKTSPPCQTDCFVPGHWILCPIKSMGY